MPFDLRSKPFYGLIGFYYWELFLSGGHFLRRIDSNMAYIVTFDLRSQLSYDQSELYYWELFLSGGHFLRRIDLQGLQYLSVQSNLAVTYRKYAKISNSMANSDQ